MATVMEARRRASRLFAVLGAVLLLAGVLPWIGDAEWPIRFLAVLLFVAGLIAVGLALKVRSVPAPSAPPVERGCEGCVCGQNGGCATASG